MRCRSTTDYLRSSAERFSSQGRIQQVSGIFHGHSSSYVHYRLHHPRIWGRNGLACLCKGTICSTRQVEHSYLRWSGFILAGADMDANNHLANVRSMLRQSHLVHHAIRSPNFGPFVCFGGRTLDIGCRGQHTTHEVAQGRCTRANLSISHDLFPDCHCVDIHSCNSS